jgi:acetyl esterase/lipase
MGIFVKNQILFSFYIIMTFTLTFQSPILMAQAQDLMTMKEVTGVDFIESDTTIQYGDDAFNFAELRIPKTNSPDRFPVVVILHGGCWLSAVANADFMRGYATALTSEGYATYNIEYRSADHPEGGWPNTFNDVRKAINVLSSLSSDYPLDLNKIILLGHSAGGHLALWASLFPNNLSDNYAITPLNTQINGIVSLAGIVDLENYFDPTNQSCGRGVGRLMGGSPEELPHLYQMGSPVDLYRVNSEMPIVLISGELDPIVTVDHVNILSDAHPEIQHLIIPQSGHFEMVVPQTEAWRQTLNVIKTMID